MTNDSGSFYEDDETIEAIRGIVAREPDGFTSRPAMVRNLRHFSAPGKIVTSLSYALQVNTTPTAFDAYAREATRR